MASFQFTNPDKFDFSRPETWEKWFQRFERFRQASGLSEKEEEIQVNTLIYSMGSEADDILSSFNLTEEDQKKWKPVTDRFVRYFIPKRNVIFERAKFNQRKQEEGETVDSFVTAIYVLADNCNFGPLHDEMIRDRLVVGLRDSKLSEKLQLDANLTLESAVSQARQTEAVKNQQSTIRASGERMTEMDAVKSSSPKYGKPKHKIPKIQQNNVSRKECMRCGKKGNHSRDQCPAREAECYKCKKRGHFAKYCLSKSAVRTIESRVESGFLGTISTKKGQPWITRVRLNNTSILFKIDTGADVTVIPERNLRTIGDQKLSKSDRKLYGPGNSELKVLGKFTCRLESNNAFSVQDIFVVKGLNQALLGRPAIQALKIIEQVNVSSVNASDQNSQKVRKIHDKSINLDRDYREKFPDLFKGLGKTKWFYSITLDKNAKPYALSTPRKVPIPLLNKVQEELDRMEKMGVISKVDEPTEWCAAMVVVPKPNGTVRICVDLTKLNESVKRENHPLPSVEESLAKLAGAKFFTKLDANSGFWQINLSEDSRRLTTFITPFGRFYINRLPFGISSAPEFFQKRMSETLERQEGTLCHMDDVLVFGETQKQHDEILEMVMKSIQKAGVTLNAEKCEFSRPSIRFLGHVVDENGCRPDPEKVKAITEMETPKCVTDIRRFLGMANQLGKFSPNLAEKSKPLREPLKGKNSWIWGPDQEQAFRDIKQEMISSPTLAHYDPNREIVVSADASSFGLGAVLRQKHGSTLRPVAFASRGMSETEQRYAQIEKEALEITWACERFSSYLIGSQFKLETDHKPLVPLMSTKILGDLPPRIQRFRMRLMRFNFGIVHVAGKNLLTADALSRAPLTYHSENDREFQAETNAYVDFIVGNLPASNTRLEQIKPEYRNDSICKQLVQFCEKGWPEKSAIDGKLQSYWADRGEFTIQNGLLMKGTRLVVPESLQKEILERIHDGHQGIVKCRERAKTSVWWKGLSTQLEHLVKCCQNCIENSRDQAEPMIPNEFPSRPWQRVASDLFELNSQTYLLVIDYFSRYIEIAKLQGTGSKAIVNHLKSIFARHGIPEVLISDNGPQYTSAVFKEFATNYGFRHITSSPKYPQGNGLAERAVQTIKRMLKKENDPYIALLTYRATPLPNGYSPAELLMGRKLQTTLPMAPNNLVPKWPDLVKLKKTEIYQRQTQKRHFDRRHRARNMKKLQVGNKVWIKDHLSSGVIKSEACTPRSYIVVTDEGEIRRNRRNLIPMPTSLSEPIRVTVSSPDTLTDSDESRAVPTSQSGYFTRSGRLSKPPERLNLSLV